jgi:bla regulator protein blaR1
LPALVTGVDADRSVPMAGAGSRVTLAAPQESKLSLSNLLLAGWAAGVALFLLPVVVGLWQIRSLRRSGLPWRRGQPVVEALALDAGIYRRVEVLLHEALPGPMTCGLVHPAVVLPRDAEDWNQEDLNRAVVHELEHVRRGDSLSRCLARIACAVYWFHPLVWVAWRKLVLEAERSCDDAVLGRSEATAYADQLVGLAKRLSIAQKSPAQRSPLLAMANRADLATRVGAVLDSRQQRGRAGTFSLALACAAAVALVGVMSPLTVVAAPQAQAGRSFEVATVKQLDNGQPKYPGGTDLSFVGTSGNPFKISGNRITLNGTLHAFVAAAYSVKDYQVSGAPSWADSLMFNITALSPDADEAVTQDQARVMLQSLLADRFQVKFHRDSKVLPVYYLVQSKSSKMFTPAGADETFSWKVTQEPGGLMRSKATNESIGDFVQLVGASADRPVIDKTGITGFIDYDILFEPGRTPKAAGPSVEGGGGKVAPNPDDLNRALLDAIQDQLGLKLQSAKDTVEILVVDHAEQPSAN